MNTWRMHASAGLPAAPPLTWTLCAAPSEPYVMATRVSASSAVTHWRAWPMTAPTAPESAPTEGLSGTLPWLDGSFAVAVAVALADGLLPAAWRICSMSDCSLLDTGGVCVAVAVGSTAATLAAAVAVAVAEATGAVVVAETIGNMPSFWLTVGAAVAVPVCASGSALMSTPFSLGGGG